MSSLASYSGESESDYGYSLTLSEEERLWAIADSLSPQAQAPKTPAPKTTKAQKQKSPPRSSTPFNQTFATVSTLQNSQIFRNPGPDFDFDADADADADAHVDVDFDDQVNETVAHLTENDLSFEISELDTSERLKLPPPPNSQPQYVASPPSSQKAPSVLGRDLSRFSSLDHRDDVSVASRSSRARSKVMQAYSEICYPDLTQALIEAQADPEAPVEDEIMSNGNNNVSTKKNIRSPIQRFRSPPKKVLAVTDLTAGSWCELQFYYVLSRRGGMRTQTAAMRRGTKIHAILEQEVFNRVTVHTSSKEDEMGLRVWNMIQGLRTLRDTGLTRELQVWGMVDGNVVSGIIDSVSYENPDPELEDEVASSRGASQPSSQRLADFLPPGSQNRKTEIFITDVKTRRTPTKPSKPQVHTSIIQLFLYHRFLSEMASDKLDYIHVFERYGLDPDEPFSDEVMAQLDDIPDISPLPSTDHSPTRKSLNNHHFNDTICTADSNHSDSDTYFASAISSPSRLNIDANLARYTTLRSLVPLLKFEMQLTFPHGASDLGKVVAVEYRYRGSTPDSDEDEVEEEPYDPEMGRVICVQSFYVEPAALDLYLEETMGWWKGDREPRGVSEQETFKCRTCEFANECDWRINLEREHLRKMRSKRKSIVNVKSIMEVDSEDEMKADGEEEKGKRKPRRKRKSEAGSSSPMKILEVEEGAVAQSQSEEKTLDDGRRKPKGGRRGAKGRQSVEPAGATDEGNNRIRW